METSITITAWELFLVLCGYSAVRWAARKYWKKRRAHPRNVRAYVIRRSHKVEEEADTEAMKAYGQESDYLDARTEEKRAVVVVVENKTGTTIHGAKLRVSGEGVVEGPWTMAGQEQGTILEEERGAGYARQQVGFLINEMWAGRPQEKELTIECMYQSEGETGRTKGTFIFWE